MKKLLMILLLLSLTCWAKEAVQVQVVKSHASTREDQGSLSTFGRLAAGSHAAARSQQVFNLDTIIKGEHVTLLCRDSKGCEDLKTGTYEGVIYGPRSMDLSFELPLSRKKLRRHYEIAGSW